MTADAKRLLGLDGLRMEELLVSEPLVGERVRGDGTERFRPSNQSLPLRVSRGERGASHRL